MSVSLVLLVINQGLLVTDIILIKIADARLRSKRALSLRCFPNYIRYYPQRTEVHFAGDLDRLEARVLRYQ